MIPAQLQAADDVLPQVILHGGREGEDFGFARSHPDSPVFGLKAAAEEQRATIAHLVLVVFRTRVEAELLGGLVGEIAGDCPVIILHIVDVNLVKRHSRPQTLHRRGNGQPGVIAGQRFAAEPVDNPAIQG